MGAKLFRLKIAKLDLETQVKWKDFTEFGIHNFMGQVWPNHEVQRRSALGLSPISFFEEKEKQCLTVYVRV